jgi:hypothetical protein
VVQALPIGSLPQLPPTQELGDAQSAVEPQVVRHAVVPQPYGAHDDVVAVWHTPLPLQVRAGVNVVPVQVGPAHWVPAA